jgi:hypothetical protein
MFKITATALDHNNVRVDATTDEHLGDLRAARFDTEEEAWAAIRAAFGGDPACDIEGDFDVVVAR